MNTKQNQRTEFIKLYLTGKYTQKELSKQIGISEVTASRWAKEIQPLRYFTIRKNLTAELERLTQRNNYEIDRSMIGHLLDYIERVEKLIIKAKYIPHLTQK